MTQDERQIEEFLNEIDRHVDQPNWGAVKELSEQVLSIGDTNADGASYLNTAKRRLKALQDIVKKATSSRQEGARDVRGRRSGALFRNRL